MVAPKTTALRERLMDPWWRKARIGARLIQKPRGREGMERAGQASGEVAGDRSWSNESVAGPGVVVIKSKEEKWTWTHGLVQLNCRHREVSR
jgi:hypothetical protein